MKGLLLNTALGLILATLLGCGGQSSNNKTVTPTSPASANPVAHSASVSISRGSSSVASSTQPTANQWVMGYYVGYLIHTYPIESIDWSGLTHIIYAPITVNDDLSLNLSFLVTDGSGQQKALALSQAAHAHNVKALLMLGGSNSGTNIAKAASPEHRTAFVNDLIMAMESLGFDGIDLDWEDAVNEDNLVALAQALRAARPNMILTYPAYPINPNYQSVDPRFVTLAASLDRFNVQTYYPTTAVAGAGWNSWFVAPLDGATKNTPISIKDTLDRYVAAGIPRHKLGMGTAFYAICYTNGITGPYQDTNKNNIQIVGGDNNYPLSAFYAADSTFAKSYSAEQKRDLIASAPYLSFTTPINDMNCGAPTQYISYEDELSIISKGTFSKANGYGGIIIWNIQEGWLAPNAAGGRAQNALMQALKQGFIDP